MTRIEVHWPSGKFMVLAFFCKKIQFHYRVLIRIRDIKISGCNLFIDCGVITAVCQDRRSGTKRGRLYIK